VANNRLTELPANLGDQVALECKFVCECKYVCMDVCMYDCVHVRIVGYLYVCICLRMGE